jgi:hypothetical protein
MYDRSEHASEVRSLRDTMNRLQAQASNQANIWNAEDVVNKGLYIVKGMIEVQRDTSLQPVSEAMIFAACLGSTDFRYVRQVFIHDGGIIRVRIDASD